MPQSPCHPSPKPGAPSRGDLVLQCLQAGAIDFDAMLAVPRKGFNLFTSELSSAGHADAAQWLNNRPAQQRRLGAGVYGLSNAALDTPWPKVQGLKQALVTAVKAADASADRKALVHALFKALADAEPATDATLPSTGLPLQRERQLSSAFIRIESPNVGVYGTRCSTVVVAERDARRCHVHVVERSFDSRGHITATTLQSLPLPLPS